MGIIGRNGTGKSTFLKLLTGAIAPDRGSVDLGESLRIGYYRQEGMTFDEGARVIDIVSDIAEHLTLADGSTLSASQLLTRFLFPPERQYDMVAKLSGGERRRLYLLTILMGGPNFLILDEPTNDLDILTLGILEEYLESFAGCVIVVSHDRFFMDKAVDHLLVFEGDGRLKLFEGSYTDYRNKQLEEEERRQYDNRNKKPAPKPQNIEKPARPRKLSYAERRELESLDGEIASLTGRKTEIETKLANPSPEDDMAALSMEYQTVSQSLDEKEMRWLELSEI